MIKVNCVFRFDNRLTAYLVCNRLAANWTGPCSTLWTR